MYTCGYAVPSRPGHCLLFSTSYADGSATLRMLLRLVPRRVLHLYTQVGGLRGLHFFKPCYCCSAFWATRRTQAGRQAGSCSAKRAY